jgi:hypothetical protein
MLKLGSLISFHYICTLIKRYDTYRIYNQVDPQRLKFGEVSIR